MLVGGTLVFDPGAWHPFGPLRWTVVTVGALLAAGYSLRTGGALHRSSARIWWLVLGWAALTASVGADPVAGWLGTPDRRFGVIGLATVFAAYVGGQAADRPALRSVLSQTAVACLLGMSAYGLLEWVGHAPVELGFRSRRLGATLGSPAYLGMALGLLLPPSLAIASSRQTRPAWRWAGAVATGSGILLLAGSGTRAALAGLVVAAGAVLVRMPPRTRHGRLRVSGALVLAVLVVIVSPLGQRLLAGDAVQGRLAEWRVAVGVVAESPLTGVGLEGYRVVFPRVVDVNYVRSYGRSTVTDRAHSAPLDITAAMGLPGLVAWMAGAGWLAASAFRRLDRKDPVLTGIAAAVIAGLAQELVLFPTLELTPITWLLGGAVVAAGGGAGRTPTRRRSGAAGLVALAILAGLGGVAESAAERLASRARATGDPAVAVDASRLRPDSFRYPLLAADLALTAGDGVAALRHIDSAQRLSPGDPALRLARARIVAALVDSRQIPLGEGRAYLKEAVTLDPHHPALRIIHGRVLTEAGDPAGAEREYLAAEHLAPGDLEPPLRLAALYLAVDDREGAIGAWGRARQIDPNHPAVVALGRELSE